MAAAIFGINDGTVSTVVTLLVFFGVVLWLALIAWTYFDAKRRIEDPVLVMCATGASVFPFVGTLVYSILRPPDFIDDRHERELEIRAAGLRVRQLEEQACPNCEHPLERTFLRCPNCRARIKNPCPACGEPIDPRWSLCPYCETALRRVPGRRTSASSKRKAGGPPQPPATRKSADGSKDAAARRTKDRESSGAPSARSRRTSQRQRS